MIAPYTSQNHPRVGLHCRGLQTVQAGRVQQHGTVAGSHPTSHVQSECRLRRIRQRGELLRRICASM
jgi:hypothetical protein